LYGGGGVSKSSRQRAFKSGTDIAFSAVSCDRIPIFMLVSPSSELPTRPL
jgi:hypothetical protein